MSDTVKLFQDIRDMAERLLSTPYPYVSHEEEVMEILREIVDVANAAIDSELPYCDPPIGCATFGLPTAHSGSDR